MRRTIRSVLMIVAAGATCGLAHAQPFADPGFGDPTTLTSPAATSVPAAAMTNAQALSGGYGFTPPATPGAPVRPQSWPGGKATSLPEVGPGMPPSAATDGYRMALNVSRSTPVKASPADPPYDPAEIVARVGTERIQACEMLPMINRAINKSISDNAAFAQLSPEDQQKEIQKAQKNFLQAALVEMINTKLLVAELRGEADKKAITENEKKIRDYFNSDYMKHLIKDYNATSIIDLENKLRAMGGSIESQRSLFVDQNLAAGWMSQAVKKRDRKATHEEMLTYYKTHATNWDTPARARWEQLTAKWSNFNTRQEAIAALAQWGDDIMVRGVPFGTVAQSHSQEYAADDGGVHDWTNKGSLLSSTIDDAIFSLPVGAMSRILEDADGCHIIRVIERDEAKRTPFTDVQPEIQQALHDGGDSERRKEYLEQLKEKTPVWTVFDDEKAVKDSRYSR